MAEAQRLVPIEARPKMQRRTHQWVMVGVLALLACGDAGDEVRVPAPKEDERPAAVGSGAGVSLNVLLLTLDTTRADALGPYGQPRITSPHLDRLAREGTLFEQVASSAPSTVPSHATIFTGRYPFVHGARANAGYVLAESNRTLAEILKSRGYRTGAEIAAPVLERSVGLDQGFDHYRDLSSEEVATLDGDSDRAGHVTLRERPADDITRWGIRFLEQHDEQPFFLWLHYFDPHGPWVGRAGALADEPYLGEIRFMDGEIGRLLERLRELGLHDRTLVVVVADHGEGLGDHGESSHSFYVFESTIRVPWILWAPGVVPANRRVDTLVRTVDILPTVLALLNLPPPSRLDGISLVPLLRGAPAPQLSAYGESIEASSVFGSPPLRFMRIGDWKYIHQPEPELYDLRNDPGELRNRASAEPAQRERLRAALEALLAQAPPPPEQAALPLDPERAAALQALGYVSAVDANASPETLASLELRGPPPDVLRADVERLSEVTALTRIDLHDRAEPLLRDLLSRHPESATIRIEHARALSALDRQDEALAALERALESAPCSVDARVEAATLLEQRGEHADQIRVLREGIENCPQSPKLLNNYAYRLATEPDDTLRDGDEAVRAARRAVEASGEKVPEILDTLAAAYAEQGDFEQAVSWAQRAVSLARSQGRPELESMLRANLERFQRGHPLRDG